MSRASAASSPGPNVKGKGAEDNVTTGIKGAVKRTILESMVKSVSGAFKVIVADTLGSQILNACMRMHDLMDSGVSLVEKLEMVRQPLPPSPAIYFIAPTAENVQRVCADWETKDMYKEAHIYFISESNNALFQIIKSARLSRSGKIRNCVDLLISFNAPETLFFSLESSTVGNQTTATAAAAAGGPPSSNDLKYFFSPASSSSDLSTVYQKKMAKTLAQVMHTLGDDPVIRHQNSTTSKRFSELFYSEYKALIASVAASDKKAADSHKANARPALLLIVDRTIDLAAPILHDYHYQTQVLECAPLKNGNVYEYRPEKNDPNAKVRECVLDELDPYWCKYRHMHFAHAASQNADDHNALYDKQVAMSNQKKSGDASVSVHQLSAQIRQLPELLEQQRKIGLHRDLVVLLDPYYSFEIACVEKSILEAIVDKKGAEYKDALKKVCQVKNSPTGKVRVESRDLLRLALLLALTFTKDFSADPTVAQTLGLGSDAAAAIRGLQLLMTVAASDISARTFGLVKQTIFKTLAEKLKNPPPIYQYYLKAVMEQCVVGTLPAAQFPFLKPADEAKLNPSNFTVSSSGGSGGVGGAGGGSSSIVTKSLRAKLAGGSSSGDKSGAGGGQLSGKSIDLGHGEVIPLVSGPRIVVFVIGGATRGEMRAAYETTRGKRREVILGSTSVTSAVGFISELQQL